MFNIKKFKSRLKSSASQYSHNEKGTASIEFVLVAPLLIALYVGLYEVSIAYTVNGTVNRASEVAASFPTFEDSLDEVTLANIMTASAAVMDYPDFDIENLAIDIYSIEQVGATPDTRRLVGKASYAGSAAGSHLPALTAANFAGTLTSLTAGNGFIVAQVAYGYEPTISTRFVDNITLQDRKILNPRENQGLALNVTTLADEERADLNCTQTDRVFTCSFTGSFPEN